MLMAVCAMLLQPSFKRAAWLTDILHPCALFSVQVVAYPPPLCTSGGKTFEKKPNHGPVSIIPTKALPSAAAASRGTLPPFKPLHLCHHHYPCYHVTVSHSRSIWCLCILSLLLPSCGFAAIGRPPALSAARSLRALISWRAATSVLASFLHQVD